MHIFFHGWFVGSIEFVYVQHILTHFFFLLSDSKAICNYNTALFFLKARKLDDIKLINIKKELTYFLCHKFVCLCTSSTNTDQYDVY